MVVFDRRRNLETSHFLTPFVGMGMTTLPFIVNARQFLPPRLSVVELIFYIEIVISVIFAVSAILSRKREEKPVGSDSKHVNEIETILALGLIGASFFTYLTKGRRRSRLHKFESSRIHQE